MSHRLLGTVLGLMGVGLYALSYEPVALSPEPVGTVPAGPPTREQILADLKLVATLEGDSEHPVGLVPNIKLTLVNTSAVRSYWVIQPGDGSDVGRNPHITYTATQDQPGIGTVEVPYLVWRWCGSYGWDWGKDVVALPPRTSLKLRSVPWPTIDFQRPGRATVRAYYRYSEGDTSDQGNPRRALLRGVPGFVLESNPVTFDVVRPLDIAVRLIGSWRVAARPQASDLVEVTLVNRSREPVEFSYPIGPDWAPWGIIECENCCGFPERPDLRLRGPSATRVMQPGESALIPCHGIFTYQRWEQGRSNVIRMRAVVVRNVPGGHSYIRSEWFEVPIER